MKSKMWPLTEALVWSMLILYLLLILRISFLWFSRLVFFKMWVMKLIYCNQCLKIKNISVFITCNNNIFCLLKLNFGDTHIDRISSSMHTHTQTQTIFWPWIKVTHSWKPMLKASLCPLGFSYPHCAISHRHTYISMYL